MVGQRFLWESNNLLSWASKTLQLALMSVNVNKDVLDIISIQFVYFCDIPFNCNNLDFVSPSLLKFNYKCQNNFLQNSHAKTLLYAIGQFLDLFLPHRRSLRRMSILQRFFIGHIIQLLTDLMQFLGTEVWTFFWCIRI